MSTSFAVRHPIGQHFIFSLPETHDKKNLQAWISKTRPAGIMLLASHFNNRTKTKELIAFLQQEAKKLSIAPLLIAVDWEGGIVSRPNESGGFFSIPSPWLLAQAGRSSCFLAGVLIGTQLKDIGVNVCFAPSLDLFNTQNHILATRCFSSNPSLVAECGIAFAKGLMSQGILPVIKHFPGLGLGIKDTHTDSVTLVLDQQTMKRHMYPFVQALAQGIPSVMVTHASFKQFGEKPATMSKQVVAYLHAKNKDALIITDDFSMASSCFHQKKVEDMIEAFNAGYPIIIFSGTSSDQLQIIANLEQQVKKLSLQFHKKLAQSYEHIKNFKQDFIVNKNHYVMPIDEKKLSQFLVQRCLQPCLPSADLLSAERIMLITVNLPKIRSSEKWFVHKDQSYLAMQFKKYGFQVDEIVLDPTHDESIYQLKDLLAIYTKHEHVHFMIQTFFYADNVWNRIQHEWLMLLKPLQKNLTVISLGHPYEETIVPLAHHISLGSFHKPLLEDIAEKCGALSVDIGAEQLVLDPSLLRKKHFGLLCHRSSVVYQNGKATFLPDALYQWARSCKDRTKLAVLFSPEHGMLGTHEAFAKVPSQQKTKWGCQLYSLHGDHKKPTPKMLKNIDVFVIDLQDVGVRCFTYLSTLKLALEAAKENNIQVVVLDRPNPLSCWGKAGPLLEPAYESFVGKIFVPFLHGLTIGSLAQKINEQIGAQLTVIACKATDNQALMRKPFIAPSPNLLSIDHIFAYPLTVFLEGTNYSEGRGTKYPFLQIGAPWVEASKLAQILNDKKMAGIFFEPIDFTPQSIKGIAEDPKHKNILCHGVFIHILDHMRVKPMFVANTILKTLFQLYPEQSAWVKWGKQYGIDLLVGNDSWRQEMTPKNVAKPQC